MSQATLHYIFDPFCGWCYAAAPLIAAAASLPEIDIALYGGGMLSGINVRQIDEDWRSHVIPHDQRIAEISGQPFGKAYYDGLLRDLSAVMDSAQPIAAILAAESLNGQGLAMLQRLQTAHYRDGERISDTPILIKLATELGHDETAFNQALLQQQGPVTEHHISAARKFLGQIGGQGFPTMALARADGKWLVLPSSQYLGKVDDWLAFLKQQID